MSNREWERIRDKDFDFMLEHSVPVLLPDNIVAKISPWKNSRDRILVGITLTTFTFNIFYLDYILTVIGTILMLLGLRTLKGENKWFKSCFIIKIIQAICLFSKLILNSTTIGSDSDNSQLSLAIMILNFVLMLSQFICLWRGFLAVQKKAGISPHASGAAALIIWSVFLFLLALIQYNGLIIGIAALVAYAFVFCSLYKLYKELDKSGYVIRPTPIKITDRFITISIVSILLVGVTCGYAFGGGYNMDWKELNSEEHTKVSAIKAELIDLGFPDYVLNDLSAEDIASCDGATKVIVRIEDHPMNDGRTVTKEIVDNMNNITNIEISTVYDVKELLTTGVCVMIPNEQGNTRWIIFHHFIWIVNTNFYGTEAIRLLPAYCDNKLMELHASGDVTGRVLYDAGGKTFTADYDFLGEKEVAVNLGFFADENNKDVFASFSMPRNSERQRGYVAYTVDGVGKHYIIDSVIFYTHQQDWLQYPVMTAMEKSSQSLENTSVFRKAQQAVQVFSDEEEQ